MKLSCGPLIFFKDFVGVLLLIHNGKIIIGKIVVGVFSFTNTKIITQKKH
jgi:hypothetical protein